MKAESELVRWKVGRAVLSERCASDEDSEVAPIMLQASFSRRSPSSALPDSRSSDPNPTIDGTCRLLRKSACRNLFSASLWSPALR